MTTTTQRRGFLQTTFDKASTYGELDYIHQRLNEFELGREVFLDSAIVVQDKRVYCMRAGIGVALPVLKSEDDGWVIFIQDRSGGATASPITIRPPAGKFIANSSGDVSSVQITTNNGYKKIQWFFKQGKYYEIS